MIGLHHRFAALLGACLALATTGTAQAPAAEDRYWSVETIPTPDDAVLEVGGLGFLADGRLVVSTRRGQVWIVDHVLADDPTAARFHLFADGLNEGLGLAVLPGDRIFVLQRHELSELSDEDGDGRCDRVRCVSNDWGLTGNYHEFAFGLPVDRDGNFYVALNLGFFDPYWFLGRANARHRGHVLRIAPDGTVTPFANGFRSPNGVSMSPDGELFVTDNQGDWVPVCPVIHVQEGRFYGHPASLDQTPAFVTAHRHVDWYEPTTDVARTPPALWLPYDLSRSTGNLAWDTTEGRFGPFTGQAFAAELTNGCVIRTSLEKVRGAWQGASFAFRPGVGAVNRIAFAPDGSLICGLTSRGWGGEGAAHGLTRVRFRGETPMEMRAVSLRNSGFEIEFTRPLAAGAVVRPEQVHASRYRYRYWWKYGSPEDDVAPLRVRDVELSADRRRIWLVVDDLTPGTMVRVTLDGIVGDGDHPLLHPRFDYTLSELREGDPAREPIAHVVPAPKTREQLAAYGVSLSDLGRTLELWEGDGWVLRSDPSLDLADPTRLATGDAAHYLVCPAGASAPLRSRFAFGDCTMRGEVMFAEQGACDVLLPCGDSFPLTVGDATPGTWMPFEIDYRAPRAEQPAAVVRCTIGDDVRAAARTLAGTVTHGPIGLVDARGGRVAFKNLIITPDDLVVRDDGSFGASGGWTLGRGGDWQLADGTASSTRGRSSITRPVPTGDFAVEMDYRLANANRAALVVLCDERGNGGIEIRLNRSAPDPLKTGSIVAVTAVRASLVPYDDTWARVRVEVQRGDPRHRVTVFVNGAPCVDAEYDAVRARGDHIAVTRLEETGKLELRAPTLEELRR